jgi:uncharacterized low-complexity protein
MAKKTNLRPAAGAVGAALAGTLLLGGTVQAADNPFGLTELGSGYMQTASSHMEGKCGEGKCGGDMKSMEGKCGEGKCGGAMKSDSKSMEGKCGEGKCGGAMKSDSKSMEGKCGEGKCGGSH